MISGHRYTPIDLQASIASGHGEEQEGQYFAKKADDIFILNLALTYRRNREKTTHELKIDFQNATNNQALVYEYYNNSSQEIEKTYQLQIFPTVIYTIEF